MAYEIKKEPEFLQIMIGKCHKILYMYEEKNKTLPKHIENTIIRFKGYEKLFDDLNGRIEFLEIISLLGVLKDLINVPDFTEPPHHVVRSQVLFCTNTLERLGEKE